MAYHLKMAVDVKQRLGARVRELRVREGYTQAELAERCKLTDKFLSAIERGLVNVPVVTLDKVARGLGVTIAELTVGIDRPLPRDVKTVDQLLAGRSRAEQLRILSALRGLLSD